jgi:hypothetical protein
MAKLADDLANDVTNYVPETFEPIEDGVYLARLEEDVEVKVGPRGPYWSWKFVVREEDNPGLTRKKVTLYHRTSLSAAAAFKLHETFAAFGVSANTDTEDLVNTAEPAVKVHVVQKVAEQGKYAGEIVNDLADGQCLYPINSDAKVSAAQNAAPAQPGPGKKSNKPLL